MAMSSGKVNQSELIAALINQADSLADGITHAQDVIDGSATILILDKDGIIAARDKYGRLNSDITTSTSSARVRSSESHLKI